MAQLKWQKACVAESANSATRQIESCEYLCTMKKRVIDRILVQICLVVVCSCHPLPSNPIYKIPPTNSVNDALDQLVTAINSYDTARFWRTFTWEATHTDLGREWTQSTLDSLSGHHIAFVMTDSVSFLHTVHNETDTALYANVRVNILLSGKESRVIDTTTILLRVDSGKWRIGEFFWNRKARLGEYYQARVDTGKWRIGVWVQKVPGMMYKAPPTNTIFEALKLLETALNVKDSALYWNSFTWENREWPSEIALTKEMWYSLTDSKVSIKILYSTTFNHAVHNDNEYALFAHSMIKLEVSGEKSKTYGPLMAVLRVDNGKWVVGSLIEHGAPFRIQ